LGGGALPIIGCWLEVSSMSYFPLIWDDEMAKQIFQVGWHYSPGGLRSYVLQG
jgi:hypothetical protein